MSNGITQYHGDCREILKTLPAESVHCCVTSPPYFGLRDYGVNGQIGLEDTPSDFISEMVKVFREVHRVLRSDGTLWLNLGDSYARDIRKGASCYDGKHAYSGPKPQPKLNIKSESTGSFDGFVGRADRAPIRNSHLGLKPKDVMGIPWRVAFALQDDGWYLRQDIIWHKPNPMPESVKDRCTKAHEYIFLLSKSQKYYYDFDAIKEPVSGTANARMSYKTPDGWDTSIGNGGHGFFHKEGREKGKNNRPKSWNGSSFDKGKTAEHQLGRSQKRAHGVTPKSAVAGSGIKANESFHAAIVDLVETRNKRSVWEVPTQPYSAAHFATFPEKLIEPCILAGCPEGGVVLDPFGGSGTTGRVAIKHRRKAILIELNGKYIELQNDRTSMVQIEMF